MYAQHSQSLRSWASQFTKIDSVWCAPNVASIQIKVNQYTDQNRTSLCTEKQKKNASTSAHHTHVPRVTKLSVTVFLRCFFSYSRRFFFFFFIFILFFFFGLRLQCVRYKRWCKSHYHNTIHIIIFFNTYYEVGAFCASMYVGLFVYMPHFTSYFFQMY